MVGLGLPLLVAVFSIPELIRALGDARFGLLTLIWALVSYFGLFDLGLGRALTQRLSIELTKADLTQVRPLIATSTALMGALGVVAAILMAILAPWCVSLISSVPSQQEAINAMYWMALAMPAVVLTSGFRGIMEAKHAFGMVNLIRLPMGLFTFLGPLVVVYYGSPRLDVIALTLTAGRIVACLIHGGFAFQLIPNSAGIFSFRRQMIKPLCAAGGWMTVSNIAGPIMGYLDRFVVGALVSAKSIAYYATPQELVSKLSILPSALVSVIFPRFSSMKSSLDIKEITLINQAAALIIIVSLPAFAAISLFSHELLSVWINEDFSENSSKILAIMSCGMLINSISLIPLTWLQAVDQSKKVATAHLIELPIFCFLLWFGIKGWGIEGAAIAWVCRIAMDAVLLWLLSLYQERKLFFLVRKYLFISIALPLFMYFTYALSLSLPTRISIMLIICSYCGYQFIKIARAQ